MAIDVGGEKSKLGTARPEMNVTPLVDVVLVLLIIFMVVTPMLSKQFWIHLPEEPDEAKPPPTLSEDDSAIVVTVDVDGTVRINHDEVPLADLSRKLKRVLAAKRRRTAFFDAEDDASFGVAAEVLDVMRAGGAATIAVMTEPIEIKKQP